MYWNVVFVIFLLYFILCLSNEALLKSIIYYCSFWILVTACSQRTAIIICREIKNCFGYFSCSWNGQYPAETCSNCSVSIKGRERHKIALDEWVEAYLVQPLKNYATGKLLLTKTNVTPYWFLSNLTRVGRGGLPIRVACTNSFWKVVLGSIHFVG